MRMSDVFDLPSRAGMKAASSASAIYDGRGTFGILNDQAMKHAVHAINNHDRMVEENKQQRESLDAFRELVKAQTQTIHDLNEENTALQRENADLKDKALKLTTTMYQLRDYLSDIECDLDQADSVFTLKDEIALIDETLTIHKE